MSGMTVELTTAVTRKLKQSEPEYDIPTWVAEYGEYTGVGVTPSGALESLAKSMRERKTGGIIGAETVKKAYEKAEETDGTSGDELLETLRNLFDDEPRSKS